MLSIIIPTLNSGPTLINTLEVIIRDTGGGDLNTEIIIADGGSTDETATIAIDHDARIIQGAPGRGSQLAAGAKTARGDWFLFIHSDTIPGPGWIKSAYEFMANRKMIDHAAVFKLRLDDDAPGARRVERLAAWRARVPGLPYGDQGLLISRAFYDAIGGFNPLPLMEDVDIVRRIGRRRLVHLDAWFLTSARRYREGGYVRRPLRNLLCLGLYLLGAPMSVVVSLYR